jgi:hypothetical protein
MSDDRPVPIRPQVIAAAIAGQVRLGPDMADLRGFDGPAQSEPTIGLLTCVRADRPSETTTMARRSTWPVRSGRKGADAKMRTGCDKEFS